MKAGGGKEKGSEFERLTGRRLSLWISQGARADLFTRNVLSGGSFTNAMKKDSREHGMPGDLSANHPLAFTFLSRFMVECKHYADLGFEAFMFDQHMNASFLGRTWTKARKEAQQASARARAKMWPMVIARQNRRPAIMLLDTISADELIGVVPDRISKPAHWRLPGHTSMFIFEDILARTQAGRFLANIDYIARNLDKD